MSKRKLLLVAMSLCMVAILAMGTTLAYLTDYEAETNVFTVGNVDITLDETFDPEDAKLLPGIDVEKKVNVTNVGTENAFVRVHIAIPTILDSGSDDMPEFAAYNNTLHWNMTKASMADGLWNWNADKNGANYPGNGGTWNTYEATVEGTVYTVYVATYETALKPNEQTAADAIHKVYLDVKLDNADIEKIIDELGEIKILVAAEAVQEAGFEGDPYGAFAAAMPNAAEGANDVVNLPTNLIQHIFNAEEIESGVTADTNANDK